VQEHASASGSSAADDRPPAVSEHRPTGSPCQVQQNYETHTAIQVHDSASSGSPEQVVDRSGVSSVATSSSQV